jgi:PAS domain S-box-containing protein
MKKTSAIRESREHRESLKTTEDSAFLQKLIDTIPIPIFYKDARGVYIGGNQAFADFLGISRKEMAGKKVHDVAPRDLADRYAQTDAELFQTGGVQTYESCVLHADGTRHDVIFKKAVFLNPNGMVGGLIGLFFDITQLKALGEQLRRSEERHRRIFENIQDVYYEVEIDGTITEISTSIEKYFPVKREELIGQSMNSFYADPEKRKDFLAIIKEKRLVRDYEIKLKNNQGLLYTCSITAAILPGDGERPPRIVGSMRDISDRKNAERALAEKGRELEDKSRMLEDVNTALRVLLKQGHEDKKDLEDRLLSNVKELVIPYVEKLKRISRTSDETACLSILETNLNDILSPFLKDITSRHADLTPREIQIASLIKDGKTTKDIADLFNVSTRAVEFHRDNIRFKLRLKNNKSNLRSYLLTHF